MNIFRKLSALITISFVLTISGCFGGGDSGGGGDIVPGVQPLTYVGKTDMASITLANAPTLVVNALYGGELVSSIPTGVSVSPNEVLAGNVAKYDNLSTMFHYSMDNTFGTAVNGYSIPLAFVVNETTYCDSGYLTLKGTLDDYTGTGTLEINYVNCVIDGVTYNGSGNMYVGYIDYYNFNATMDFVLLTMTSSNYSSSMSGSFTENESIYGNQFSDTMTINAVMQDNISNKMYKYDNYSRTITINDIYAYDSSASISFSGTIYDSIYGGIAVNTVSSLSFSSYTKLYPDNGGTLILFGNNSSIQLTAESERHIKLEMDLDGVGGYEVVRYVLWKELDDPASMNLADTDGDGMHDSWEMMYSLNPNINDAGDDADSDGYTNLEEYQAGTDPQDPLSTPATP